MGNDKERRKRILHVINGMGTGGAEKDIMNWYRNIDRNIYQFDFLIRSHQYFYKDEIERLGGNLFETAPFPGKILRNYCETKNFFKRHGREYDVVHVHGNALIYMIPLFFAKKYGIKKRIMHIHNTKASSLLGSIIHYINRMLIGIIATDCAACSHSAGKFGFRKEFHIINNAIDMDKYDMDRETVKNKYCSDFGIGKDTMVLGHVGRFLPVKNHKFIIECFSKIAKQREAVLFLVGDGELRSQIQEDVLHSDRKGIFFLGERSDIPQLLHFFDIMIFPSLYEGVPLVPLEAQASSTKIVCADTITEEIYITGYAKKLSLKRSAEEWAKYIIDFYSRNMESIDVKKRFTDRKYDIESIVKDLVNIYTD